MGRRFASPAPAATVGRNSAKRIRPLVQRSMRQGLNTANQLLGERGERPIEWRNTLRGWARTAPPPLAGGGREEGIAERRPRAQCLPLTPTLSRKGEGVAHPLRTPAQHHSRPASALFALRLLHGLSVGGGDGRIRARTHPRRTRFFRRGRPRHGPHAEGYRGSRYSFAYPACPKLDDQELLLRLLGAERIGIALPDEWQLGAEQSTSAIVVLNLHAKYFTV